MDKAQALHKFWNSFGWKAYDEATVPADAQLPYITYNVMTDRLDGIMNLHADLWDRGYTWKSVEEKASEIGKAIGREGHATQKIDGGYIWYVQGVPFAQRMRDDDDQIRRVYINVQAEFLTAY